MRRGEKRIEDWCDQGRYTNVIERRQIYRQTDRKIDRHTEKQTDRQTQTHQN